MNASGPLLGVVVGALLTWFFSTQIRRDDRRRDAWAAWGEHAYRLILARRELVERCWTEQGGADRPVGGLESFGLRVSNALVGEIETDAQLHAALARVLLSEPSSVRRDQARAFTELLSEDVEQQPTAKPRAVLRRHRQYIAALQATLDNLFGRFAEVGTPTQVVTWFKQKYNDLTSKNEPIKIVDSDDCGDDPQRPNSGMDPTKTRNLQ